MSSGICKNNKDDDEKKINIESKSNFKFWIYVGLILLGLLFIIIIGFIIYSLLSSNINNKSIKEIINNQEIIKKPDIINSSTLKTTSIPIFPSKDLTSTQAPNISITNPSIPPPKTTISNSSNSFLSNLMLNTSNNLLNITNREIPIQRKIGGFRCMNRRTI